MMVPRPEPGPEPSAEFDYAAAAEEIQALPTGSPAVEVEPPIPLELILKPAPVVPRTIIGLFSLVILLGVALWYVRDLLERRRWADLAPEHVAMQGLLGIGAAQRAYASMNQHQHFGLPADLRRVGQVSAGFTPTSAIPGYSITFWSLGSPVWEDTGMSPSSVAPGSPYRTRRLIAPSSFTLVAIPLAESSSLRTFALCDDGVLRSPAELVSNFEGACAWPLVPADDLPRGRRDG